MTITGENVERQGKFLAKEKLARIWRPTVTRVQGYDSVSSLVFDILSYH